MQATDEQVAAIDQAKRGESFKIMAYAGSGKTTTLKLISEQLHGKKGIYLAFNKAIAEEAKSKFPASVDCRTFHSLAFRHVDRRLTDKLRLPRLSPLTMASEFNLSPINMRRQTPKGYTVFSLSPSRQANFISQAVSQFCATNAQYPAPRHLQLPNNIHPDDADELRYALYPHVEKRWQDAIDPYHRAGIGHDIYLKCWALSEPIIPVDYILFDEAQDSDPLMLGILLQQHQAQVIYVGDAHQQIYQWRGAINAMQKLPLAETRLTRSFRFGQEIADLANLFLRELGETIPLQGMPNLNSKVDLTPILRKKNAVLCRTNARAMSLVMSGLLQGDKVALQADSDRLIKFVDAASALLSGKKVFDVPELSWFSSWAEVREYGETSEGSDMKALVKLIDDHGTTSLKKALKKISPIESADYVISTAHKAKGLEWDQVLIEDDYNYSIKKGEVTISAEELRLLYVAVTRGKALINVHHIKPLLHTLALTQAKASAKKT